MGHKQQLVPSLLWNATSAISKPGSTTIIDIISSIPQISMRFGRSSEKEMERKFETYRYYSVELYIIVVAPPRKLHEVPHGLWGVLVIKLYRDGPDGCL
jgi:hypothetical protein